MSDLIKRENAIATIGVMYERCGGDITDYRDLLIQCFKDLPSGIVRCVECKHWDTADGECYADRGIYFPKADDFCSYGERNSEIPNNYERQTERSE